MESVKDYLKKMHTRDNSGSNQDPDYPAVIYLYPYQDYPSITSAIQSDGTVTKAIKNALDQLMDYNAINYYAIHRLKYGLSATTFPDWGDIEDCSYSDIQRNFKHWLGAGTDTGSCQTSAVEGNYNFYGLKGVHQLIHSNGSGNSGCNETSGPDRNYAPVTAGAERHGQTAFKEARAAWSPVCSYSGLEKAAAIQEAVHMMMHPHWDRTVDCDADATRPDCKGTYPRQHSTGTLDYLSYLDTLRTTPMLAYHWDDFDKDGLGESPNCPCPVDRKQTPDTHTTTLTNCAKESVYDTARNLGNLTDGC